MCAKKSMPVDSGIEISAEAIAATKSKLEQETDRGCALIASEWLNDSLDKLLRTKFESSGLTTTEQNRLLKTFGAPLYSFAVRIAVCRAFGLISEHESKVLTAVREIRNHCAHSRDLVSFKDSQITKWVQVLQSTIVRKTGKIHDLKHLMSATWGIMSMRLVAHQIVILKLDLELAEKRARAEKRRLASQKNKK